MKNASKKMSKVYSTFTEKTVVLRSELEVKDENTKKVNIKLSDKVNSESIEIKKLKALKSISGILPYNKEKLKEFIQLHCYNLDGINEKEIDMMVEEITLTVFEGMDVSQYIETMVLVAAQNIQNNIQFDKIAVRLLITKIYSTSFCSNDVSNDFKELYSLSFIAYINKAVKFKLLSEDMAKVFDLQELSNFLDPYKDDIFKFIGISTARNRYMIKDRSQNPIETPQFFWMRVAMGMSLKEKDPTSQAKIFYKKLSNIDYIAGGSTLIGAGTTYPILSNCYLLDTQDDINNIFDNVKNIALISKATGGIGLAITKLRADGSPIMVNNTFSSGPIPFAHVMDATIRAISRAGKKMGALCFYMENWHINFSEFLDLKENSGDHYRRTPTANTAVYISDEFMKRVIDDEDWYLFDPAEVMDLTELYGSAFSKRYAEYIEIAKAGKMRVHTVIKARDQMKRILISLQATSHPWLTWKDTINLRALNNNTGTIHSSNLCTEVCLPQDKDNIAVCNLLYINLINHVKETGSIADDKIDWLKLEESVQLGIRHLDNLIEVGLNLVKEARHSDENNRAVGLGVMGFAEMLEKFGYAYDSKESYDLIDRVIEFISFKAIEESHKLANIRGKYPNFAGSMWSKGYVPFDTIVKLEKDRKVKVDQDRSLRLDWEGLRKKVKKGMRNATVMMIAPNASTGLVAGTSNGVDPRFAQIFSRATSNGKFLDINHNLVEDLKKLNLWESLKEIILEKYGDISEISDIPQKLKDIYKTSFQIDPLAFIEVASRAQKWIDQSISRNMYLESGDIDDIMNVYIEAWKRGVKTTYYLHMKPRHTAEQSTIKVNKSESIGKIGFGFAKSKVEIKDIDLSNSNKEFIPGCPLDPNERALCESCQ